MELKKKDLLIMILSSFLEQNIFHAFISSLEKKCSTAVQNKRRISTPSVSPYI
jgi:hypothetical protein